MVVGIELVIMMPRLAIVSKDSQQTLGWVYLHFSGHATLPFVLLLFLSDAAAGRSIGRISLSYRTNMTMGRVPSGDQAYINNMARYYGKL